MCALLAIASSIKLTLNLNLWPELRPNTLTAKLSDYGRTPGACVEAMVNEQPGAPYPRAIQELRRRTGPADRILILPTQGCGCFFAERPFAGRQCGIMPGFFSTETDHRRMIMSMQRASSALLLEFPDFYVDDERNRLRNFAPLLNAYLENEFEPVTRYGAAVLRLPKADKVKNAAPARAAIER